MRYLSIKNLGKYQHYKNRRPPWIKLHAALFDDYAFQCLQDASKAHLMLLWLLASQMDNRVPYDLTFIGRKLGSTSRLDIEELILQGFIEVSQDDSKPLASRKQMPIVETEAERETEADLKAKKLPAPRSAPADEELLSPEKPPSDWACVFAQDYNAASEGVISPGEVGKQVKPLYSKHPYTAVHSKWLWFVASPKREFGAAWFRKNFGSIGDPAPRMYSGELSPDDFKRLSA